MAATSNQHRLEHWIIVTSLEPTNQLLQIVIPFCVKNQINFHIRAPALPPWFKNWPNQWASLIYF